MQVKSNEGTKTFHPSSVKGGRLPPPDAPVGQVEVGRMHFPETQMRRPPNDMIPSALWERPPEPGTEGGGKHRRNVLSASLLQLDRDIILFQRLRVS